MALPDPTIPRKKTSPENARAPSAETEALAADILGYLAEDAERLRRFFDLTGFEPQTLRAASEEPAFAGHMLEYLCSDDRLVLAFAAARGRDPAAIEAARQRLAQYDHGEP